FLDRGFGFSTRAQDDKVDDCRELFFASREELDTIPCYAVNAAGGRELFECDGGGRFEAGLGDEVSDAVQIDARELGGEAGTTSH
ncbi:hypothetical protein LTR49_024563, partial [Elasticomyces elasticus]